MACICSICQNTIQSNKAAALLCGHIFDMQCINTWIGHSPVCPICRTFTRYENIIPVFLTNDDQEEGQALSDDFAGLIDQLDNIRITKGKLSSKQIKRLENLHRIHSKEISNLANQLDKVENEKQEMEVDRHKRFERLCKIHTDEMASLSHHSPKGNQISRGRYILSCAMKLCVHFIAMNLQHWIIRWRAK